MEAAEKDKKVVKQKKKTWTRQSVHLLNQCIGVIFFYALFFNLINNYIVNPLMDKLQSMAILTIPDNYISLDNAIMIIKHPLVLLAMLLEALVFCMICLLKNTGMMMCLEACYQGKPVHFFRLFPYSIRQVRHALKPKNWQIFFFIVVIQPFVNADVSSAMSALTIPEFIMDVINAKLLYSILYYVVFVFALIIFVRYLFLQQFFILHREDFKQAAKHSIHLRKNNKLILTLKLIWVSIVARLVYCALPAFNLFAGDLIISYFMKNYTFVNYANRFILNSIGYPLINGVGKLCVNLLVTAYLLIAFHETEKAEGIENPPELPEKLFKTKGHIYNFRLFRHFVMAFSVLGTLFLFVSLTIIAENNSEVANSIMSYKYIVAHKGYSSQAPENTMSSFDLASKSDSVSYIELDVRETKDGVPVVIHNESIGDATNDKDKRSIYDITWEELQTINASYKFEDEYPEEKIPSLEEVLQKYADNQNLIIEIKMSDRTPQLPDKIVALMEKYHCTETSMIHSGNYKAISRVKEINPDIKCGYIITLAFGGYYDLPAADFFTAEYHLATNSMLENVHSRNKEVFVWTVNNEDTMQKMINKQVDGVITDYPDTAYEIVNGEDSDFILAVSNIFTLNISTDDMVDQETDDGYLSDY